jgi:hypothetical protein
MACAHEKEAATAQKDSSEGTAGSPSSPALRPRRVSSRGSAYPLVGLFQAGAWPECSQGPRTAPGDALLGPGEKGMAFPAHPQSPNGKPVPKGPRSPPSAHPPHPAELAPGPRNCPGSPLFRRHQPTRAATAAPHPRGLSKPRLRDCLRWVAVGRGPGVCGPRWPGWPGHWAASGGCPWVPVSAAESNRANRAKGPPQPPPVTHRHLWA